MADEEARDDGGFDFDTVWPYIGAYILSKTNENETPSLSRTVRDET
jgi:hypothetical protein